jgi:hypothetical protein
MIALVGFAFLVSSCGPQTIDAYENREFADIAEFDPQCGLGDRVTSFMHLPGYFDSAKKVNEVVQPELDRADFSYDLSRVVDAGGVWLFVSDDETVFGAADKASGTITYCMAN